MAMQSWMANCCRVESDGTVKSWISFSSVFGCFFENHSCTRDEGFFVLFRGNLRARAARILVSSEYASPTSGGGRIVFAEYMLG